MMDDPFEKPREETKGQYSEIVDQSKKSFWNWKENGLNRIAHYLLASTYYSLERIKVILFVTIAMFAENFKWIQFG